MVQGTLHDDTALREGCESVDVIFHSAALTAARSRAEFFSINAAATRRLTEVAAEWAPNLQHFVYVSSQAAAGPSQRGHPKSEADPTDPVSDYGASKLAGEECVRHSGLPWTIVRPSSVYGPRDTAFLTVFKGARLGVVPTFGDSAKELSFVFIDDLIRALVAVVSTPATREQTYFVCHPEILTMSDVARSIYRAVKGRSHGDPLVVCLPESVARLALGFTGAAARIAGKTTLLSTDKARELLAEAWTCEPGAVQRDTGWTAEVALTEGSRKTAAWYREHGLL
jgi:nucleoside-diphosphate-sugar epimerase